MPKRGTLLLEDGTVIEGVSFGYPQSRAGEVVFNTGMVGYPESFTDPSYYGQILVLTYPLIGNYGVPRNTTVGGLPAFFESDRPHIAGLIVANYSHTYSHYRAAQSLGAWLTKTKVPALTGIDTRQLTKKLRERGTMLGKIVIGRDVEPYDPNAGNVLPFVSVRKSLSYGKGPLRVVLYDCGVKNNIIRELVARGVQVLRVPWDYPLSKSRLQYDGVVLSNGPGDPTKAGATIAEVARLLKRDKPVFGICLGIQLMALAVGAKTYKLTFGHRSQNQPCQDIATGRCYITSQNHGFAVNDKTLRGGFLPWFVNLNDNTLEGMKHASKPFMAVQFHPEATPGPLDTSFLFDQFLSMVKRHGT